MLIVDHAVDFHGILIADLSVSISNVSAPVDLISSLTLALTISPPKVIKCLLFKRQAVRSEQRGNIVLRESRSSDFKSIGTRC